MTDQLSLLGEPPTDGLAEGRHLKAEALAILEQHHGDKLQAVRWAMRVKYQQRVRLLPATEGFVTADDVRDYLDLIGFPEDASTKWLGAIWHEPGWYRVGYTQSRRPARHAGSIGQWAWRNDA